MLEVAGLDPTTEPVPFVGRSRELDLVNLAAYMDNLLVRASRAAGCDTRVLANRGNRGAQAHGTVGGVLTYGATRA